MSYVPVKDKSSGRFVSVEHREYLVAKVIFDLPCMNGNAKEIYSPALESWRQDRQCAWCGMVFSVNFPAQKFQRFCGKSCSAKWRMSQKEIVAKVHTKEVHQRIGKKRSEWYKQGSPEALEQIERIRKLNPMNNAETRKKVSEILRAMHHKPIVRGGNGHLTNEQVYLQSVLQDAWIPEYAISLGKRKQGYPTCYKVDLGNPDMKIAIEIDGNSHYSRKELDKKKDDMLESSGWRVLRFTNHQVQDLINADVKTNTYVFVTLLKSGIQTKLE